jgi:hypothetical protein
MMLQGFQVGRAEGVPVTVVESIIWALAGDPSMMLPVRLIATAAGS